MSVRAPSASTKSAKKERIVRISSQRDLSYLLPPPPGISSLASMEAELSTTQKRRGTISSVFLISSARPSVKPACDLSCSMTASTAARFISPATGAISKNRDSISCALASLALLKSSLISASA